MTPSTPHEALAFFEGSWTIEERPAEWGLVETCSFMEGGRRHMICRSAWTLPSGPRTSMSIFSYSEADSAYLYYGLRTNGLVVTMRGQPQPEGWEFVSESGTGTTRTRARVIIKRLSKERFRLTSEFGPADGQSVSVSTDHYRPAGKPKP